MNKKNLKNKRFYIALAIIVAILLTIVLVVKNKTKKSNISEPILPTVYLSEVFEIDDIEKAKYEIKKSNNQKIASKYITTEQYVMNANVELEKRNGKMIYIRNGNVKMNIYQTKYRIDELDYTNGIDKYINDFLQNISSYIGGELLQKEDGVIYGETGTTPYLEESIFKDKRLYTFHYEEDSIRNSKDNSNTDNSESYDINFYMNDIYLMCELVKIL